MLLFIGGLGYPELERIDVLCGFEEHKIKRIRMLLTYLLSPGLGSIKQDSVIFYLCHLSNISRRTRQKQISENHSIAQTCNFRAY
jgi:hypothetical protein